MKVVEVLWSSSVSEVEKLCWMPIDTIRGIQKRHGAANQTVFVSTDGQNPAALQPLLANGAVVLDQAVFDEAFRTLNVGAMMQEERWLWPLNALGGQTSNYAQAALAVTDWWLLVRSSLFIGNPASSFSSTVCLAKLEKSVGVCHLPEMAFVWMMYVNSRDL
jgi:hypothetical protein